MDESDTGSGPVKEVSNAGVWDRVVLTGVGQSVEGGLKERINFARKGRATETVRRGAGKKLEN
jgi:hypothetical protein